MPKPRFPAAAVDALIVEPDASARELHQAGDAVERRRLAAARRSKEADELAALDRQRQLVQRGEGMAACPGESARDTVELEFAEIVLHGEVFTA
jgi:hypothetical protein